MKFNEKWKYLLHGRDAEMEHLKQEQESLKKQLERLKMQYDIDCHLQTSGITKRLLYVNLNHKNVYMIDYENISMLPQFVTKDKKGVCYIFVGNRQKDKATQIDIQHQFAGLHYILHVNRQKKNALDTVLSFYLGQIYSAFEPDNIFVISNDSDYENLKQLSLYYPSIHYEQITLDIIARYEHNKTSDIFFQRFLLDYISIYTAYNVKRDIFIQRLKGSKVHGMETTEVQYALHRMKKMHLIKEYTQYGRRYILLIHENIATLKDKIPRLDEAHYMY